MSFPLFDNYGKPIISLSITIQENIIKWLSLKSSIEYIGEWETLFNPDFKCTEFGTFIHIPSHTGR